jgi:hypothetical protein
MLGSEGNTAIDFFGYGNGEEGTLPIDFLFSSLLVFFS